MTDATPEIPTTVTMRQQLANAIAARMLPVLQAFLPKSNKEPVEPPQDKS